MLSLPLRVGIFNYNAKYHLIPQATKKYAVTFHNKNRRHLRELAYEKVQHKNL
jgi:hypothetical protein